MDWSGCVGVGNLKFWRKCQATTKRKNPSQTISSRKSSKADTSMSDYFTFVNFSSPNSTSKYTPINKQPITLLCGIVCERRPRWLRVANLVLDKLALHTSRVGTMLGIMGTRTPLYSLRICTRLCSRRIPWILHAESSIGMRFSRLEGAGRRRILWR